MNILVVFYSMYGHVFRIAEAIAEGAGSVEGIRTDIRRIPQTLPLKRLEQTGALTAQKVFETIPICTAKDFYSADAIIFGTSRKSDNKCVHLKQFLEMEGKHGNYWELADKPASIFSGSTVRYMSQESAMLDVRIVLLDRGMLMVDLPCSFDKQANTKGIARDLPFDSSSFSSIKHQHRPGENELKAAMFYGKQFATTALNLYNTGLNGLKLPQHGSAEPDIRKRKIDSLWDEVRRVPYPNVQEL